MNNRDALSFYNNTLRVGGTSWVIPGTFSENLRCLSKDVSDMEIVLFDTPEQSNIPSKDEVKEQAISTANITTSSKSINFDNIDFYNFLD